MPLFLDADEKSAILTACRGGDSVVGRFRTALRARAGERSSTTGLPGSGPEEDAPWWYPAAEYVSDAAMVFALEPDDAIGNWLRDAALAIARSPTSDWVGPPFRDHHSEPPVGHLETAHLCWALAVALDLAPEAFAPDQRREVEAALGEKGIPLCRRWLERNTHLANWRAVMAAGVAVAAAVLGDRITLEESARETLVCARAYQPDGSYAESLQYANYLAYALVMAHEAVHRAAPELAVAGPEVVAKLMPWMAQSMIYAKPLPGWVEGPRARAVNFGDCGAIFRPSGDVLLCVATRCRETMPTEAGLARWLFDTFYAPVPSQGPHNLATFGLRPDWGFLTLPLLVRAAEARSPAEAGLPETAAFSNGHVLVRDAWEGRTVLAIQGGTGPLHGPGHIHGDLNSFLLVHNRERLLVDPGHSCYRNLIRGLESSTRTHNTCTFLVAEDELGLQEDLAKAALMEQSSVARRRWITGGKPGDPVPPRGRLLLAQRRDEVTAVGSDAASAYGPPIEEFSRFWLSAGPHVLFVVDRIRASRPVRSVWNWLVNNRDGRAEVEDAGPDKLVLRRGPAGLVLAHLAGGQLQGPVYAYVHDAYHPMPARTGEGRPGSGLLYRWTEPEPRESRLAVHVLVVDDDGRIADWTVRGNGRACSARCGTVAWSLVIDEGTPLRVTLQDESGGRHWQLAEEAGQFTLTSDETD